MKNIANKISNILRVIFGYGIMICLFLGGLALFGYIAALFIGGETATAICTFIYKTYYPIIIRASIIMVLIGILAMYLNGETSLTINKPKAKKK